MAADTLTSPSGKTLLLRTAKLTTLQENSEAKIVQISPALDNCICALVLEKNEFGDTLPIITTDARTEHNKVLYQQKIKATLTSKSDGKPVRDQRFSLRSNRHGDQIDAKGKTNAQGEITFVLLTREPGELELSIASAGITMSKFIIKLQEAWFESPFLITGYNVCDENDFSGELVEGKGLDEKHKDDFLFGAAGACQIFCVERGHEIIPKGLFHDRSDDHQKAQETKSRIPVPGRADRPVARPGREQGCRIDPR